MDISCVSVSSERRVDSEENFRKKIPSLYSQERIAGKRFPSFFFKKEQQTEVYEIKREGDQEEERDPTLTVASPISCCRDEASTHRQQRQENHPQGGRQSQ